MVFCVEKMQGVIFRHLRLHFPHGGLLLPELIAYGLDGLRHAADIGGQPVQRGLQFGVLGGQDGDRGQ